MAFWNKIFNRSTKSDEVDMARRGFSFSKGVNVSEETSMKVSAYYRGVIYISTQMAKLPWNVKDKANIILTNDPIYKLLNKRANPEMSSFQWKLWALQTAIHKGNSYSEIERDGTGRPLALWPLRTSNVDPIRVDGKLVYRVIGGNANGTDVFLEPRNVFHVRNFHTTDGLIGQGLVAYAINVLGITIGADRMAGNMFKNGGIPAGFLKHKGTLSDQVYKRLKESWDQQNGGENSSGVTILEEDMDFKALNMDAEQLQFLESRKFGVLEMARFLGLPPTKLFDQSTATYSNVENANLEVAVDTLDAWAFNLESEAEMKLLNNWYGDRYTQMDLYAVFRGDMKTRSGYFKDMMSLGAITPNQIREKEGEPGYGPTGDKYYIATNNYTPADMVEKVIQAQIDSKKKDDTPPAKKPTDEDSALRSAIISYLSKA